MSCSCSVCDVVLTLDAVTEAVQMLHGAGVTLQALGPSALLQGGHGERLLQSQHDLIHLPMGLVPPPKNPQKQSNKQLHILNPILIIRFNDNICSL